jgi:hypothetical protein
MARKQNPTTRLYQVKPGKSGWARIWITDDGCISIMSDWGDYGYWFGDPAMEFRAFLLQCDDDYLGNKFAGGKKEFDGEETADAARELILRHRREKRLDAEDARREWRGVPTMFDGEVDYAEWVNHQTELGFDYTYDLARYVRPHAVRQFLKHVWPLFVELLRAELASEAPPCALPETAQP